MHQYTLPEMACGGFVEDRNLVVEVHHAGGVVARLPALARPGGWLTGIALQSRESEENRLEVLRQLLPTYVVQCESMKHKLYK